MPNIFHQSVEEILRAATPEQKLLWNFIFLRFGERVAVSQLYLQANAAGIGELAVYSANRIYLCYQFEASEGGGVYSASPIVSYFFNENNAAFGCYSPTTMTYDSIAAAGRYYPTHFEMKNFYFSRIQLNTFDYFKFIGYRIGI